MTRAVKCTLSSLLIAASVSCPVFAGGALAQSVTQADVGRFIRDQNGDPIGSLQAIRGNQAVVWYGFVNTPGNHMETVPLSAIAVSRGRLVLNGNSTGAVAAR